MTAAAAITPSRLDAVFERVAEWAGPLVVKEVRAGLKSRAFAIAFGLQLLVGFVVTLGNAAVAASRESPPKGAENFLGTTAAFVLFGELLIPFIAYRAMVREREDETWVLLVLTGLGTDGIVRGKQLSAWVQLGLGAAATAPFMLLSYLLSGIGLMNVLVGVWWHLGVATCLTSFAVGLAAQSETRLERTAGHFVVLGGGGLAGAASLALTGALAFNGERTLREGEVVALFVGLPLFLLALSWCVQPAAAASLALDSEARSHPARVRFVSVMALAVVATAVLSVWLEAESGFLVVPATLGALVLLVIGFFAFSERPGFPKSAVRDGVGRPGAFRSAFATVALLVLSGAVFAPVAGLHHQRAAVTAVAAPSFVSLYLSLGYLVGRFTPLRRLGTRASTRLGFFIATALGVAVPSGVALMTNARVDRGPLWPLNPVFGFFHFVDSTGNEEEVFVLAALTLLATFVALLSMFGEDGVRTHEH